MTAVQRIAAQVLLALASGVSVCCAPCLAYAQGFDLKLPERLSLGTEREAQISVRAPREGQAQFFSNIGRVTDVRQEGDRLVATYHAPEERYPQVAILVVASPDLTQIEWGSIPLYGQPTVKIRYERRANVLVRAGEREFGPVQTDRRGRAELKVEVAPGVRSVTVFGADRQGTTKERENPLEVPQFDRVFLLCPTERRVFGFAVDQSGNPLRENTIPIDAEVGARNEIIKHTSGATVASFDVPDDALSTFTVSSQDPETGQIARCTPPPRASGFEVSMPETFVAGQGPLEVAVRPTYEANVVPEVQLAPVMQVDFGTLGHLREREDAFVATWNLPNEFGERSVAVLSVRSARGGSIDRHDVSLQAAEVDKLGLRIEDDSLPANGMAQTRLTARLEDRYGNAAHVKAQLSGEARGKLGSFVRQSDGSWIAKYIAPDENAGDVDTIVVHDSSRNLRAKVRLELRADHAAFLLSARVGYITNLSKVTGPIALLGIRYRLPFLEQMPVVGLDVGGYLSSTTDLDNAGVEEVEVELFGLPVLVRAGLSVPLAEFDLYVHLAGGLLWSSVDVRSQSSGQVVEDDMTFMLGGVVGSEVPLGPGALLIEAGYLLAPRGGAVGGQGGGLVVDLGYGIGF